jgi:hypothetical protein
MLIPGIFMRKSLGVKALETTASVLTIGAFAAEKTLIKKMKRVYLELSDSVMAQFGDKAGQEQEILLALADVAIEIFALESSVLRAEKASVNATENKKELFHAVCKVCAFNARQQFVNAAEKCAVFIEGDDGDAVTPERSETNINYNSNGLLSAKHLLADATSQAEQYIF